MLSALSHRDYRLLWAGQTISLLGDQFHLVALPWLVLTLTHDPLQLGLVLASASVPRALFMLVGGAAADRYSPRAIMLASDIARLAMSTLLAVSLLTGLAQLWMVYAVAVVFGTVSGFFHPAANAAIPRLLDDSQLESGNSLFQIADQAAAFLGPAAAGVLIAVFGSKVIGTEQVASMIGLATAFGVDALSFAVSAGCLLLMRSIERPGQAAEGSPLRAVHEGLVWVWNEPSIRWMLIIIACANSFVSGPLLVGLPVLTSERLTHGVVSFGVILSAFAAGNLVGMFSAGLLPRPTGRVFVAATFALIAGFGIAIGALAFVTATWHALPLMVIVGVGNGYMSVTFITQLQRVTPNEMLGRVMGLFMLSMYGLMPISQALSGVIVRGGSLEVLFVGNGMLLVLVALLALSRPELRSLSDRLEVRAAES